MTKQKLAIIIFIIGCLAVPFFVFSESTSTNSNTSQNLSPEVIELNSKIEEKRQKIKELEASIEDYKNKINQKKSEAQSLKNQMSILDNKTAQVRLDIEATQEMLSTIQLEIQSLDILIKEKERTITKQKEIIKYLIRNIYQNDSKSYIEIATAYNNFSDFYNQIHYVQTLQTELSVNVRNLNTTKTDLETKKQQKNDKKLAYEDLSSKLNNKLKDLKDSIFVKEDLLTKTKSSEMVYNTMLNTLKKQYQDIEGEITSIEKEVRKRLEKGNQLQNIAADDSTTFSWPVTSHYVSSVFHDPEYPYRNVFEHTGMDIRASHGTAVKAAASGYIARAKRCTSSSCYSYVMLVHTEGLATVYGHLSSITVEEDQFVTRGDIIGYSGGTPGTVGAGPFVTGAHLHFEVRKNGIPTDPANYL